MHKSYNGDAASYRLYGAGHILGLISRVQANRMLRAGRAEEGVDRDGTTTCFQSLAPEHVGTAAKRAVLLRIGREEVALSAPSCVAFSSAEVMAIAGVKFKRGKSETARLKELPKIERVQRIYAETGTRVALDDLVERATDKLREWNTIGTLLADVKVVEHVCLS